MHFHANYDVSVHSLFILLAFSRIFYNNLAVCRRRCCAKSVTSTVVVAVAAATTAA
jgi:hypothetical protein